MNSAHFSGVSTGSASETKTWTSSPVEEVTGPPRQVMAPRAARSTLADPV